MRNNQPRLLVFSVDAAEGKTVTFDSCPIAGDSKKPYQSKYDQRKEERHNE